MNRNEEKDMGEGIGGREEKKPAASTPLGSNLPAPVLALIFKGSIKLHLIGLQLKIYAALINHYPYVLNGEAWERFQEYQQKYQQDSIQFATLQNRLLNPEIETKEPVGQSFEAVEAIFKRAVAMHKNLHRYLTHRLEDFRKNLQDNSLAMTVKRLADTLIEHDKVIPESAITINTQTVREACGLVQTQTDQQLQRLQTDIANAQQAGQKKYTLAKCRDEKMWDNGMLVQQQTILAIQKMLQNAEEMLDGSAITRLSIADNAVSSFADLIFLTTILKPATTSPRLDAKAERVVAPSTSTSQQDNNLSEALKRKLQFEWKLYWQAQQTINTLKTKLTARYCEEAIRLLRAQTLYERWRQILDFFAEQKPSGSRWENIMKIQRLLTYEKKAFFKQFLTQQQGYAVIQNLNKLVEKYPKPQALLQQLQMEKDRLAQQITTQEERLTAGHTRWEKMSTTAWLSVSQQPDFQLGELAFLSGVRQMDRLPANIPILSEQLPEQMKKQWAGLTGFTFFIIGLSVSNYFGYYAHLIGAINRVLSSQISAWFRAGNRYDRALSRHVLPFLQEIIEDTESKEYRGLYMTAATLKQALRGDEIGLLENDRRIQWLNGLFINVGLTPTQPWLPTIAGYSFATAVADAAMFWLDEAASYRQLELESSHFIKVAVHLAIYSQAYRCGLIGMYQILPPSMQPQMSQSEALQHFGLLKPPQTEREVKGRYHELSRRYHPDKCIGVDCIEANEKMAMINGANEVLMQQFK